MCIDPSPPPIMIWLRGPRGRKRIVAPSLEHHKLHASIERETQTISQTSNPIGGEESSKCAHSQLRNQLVEGGGCLFFAAER